MARALMNIRHLRVLVEDIASRNFVLVSDLSIYFCDFATSSELPPDTDMELADVQGCSVKTDIGQLGAVMYEIVTGKRIPFDLWKDIEETPCFARLPTRTNLPSTEGVWLGSIIEKCWTGAFLNARELLDELESVHLDKSLSHRVSVTFLHHWMSLLFTPLLGAAVGALTLAVIWTWKPFRASWLHSS